MREPKCKEVVSVLWHILCSVNKRECKGMMRCDKRKRVPFFAHGLNLCVNEWEVVKTKKVACDKKNHVREEWV